MHKHIFFSFDHSGLLRTFGMTLIVMRITQMCTWKLLQSHMSIDQCHNIYGNRSSLLPQLVATDFLNLSSWIQFLHNICVHKLSTFVAFLNAYFKFVYSSEVDKYNILSLIMPGRYCNRFPHHLASPRSHNIYISTHVLEKVIGACSDLESNPPYTGEADLFPTL